MRLAFSIEANSSNFENRSVWLRFAHAKDFRSSRTAPWILTAAIACLLVLAADGWAEQPSSVQSASSETSLPETSADEAVSPAGWIDDIDGFFGKYIVAPLSEVLFFGFGTERWLGYKVPFVVAWLFFGAIFFTVRMRFINIRAFWHAIRVTKGDYDDPNDDGEVSHFQALASALSATVGLGNIAGVAIAVCMGGPGAIFWLILTGIFGMSLKFSECTLGQLYRKVDHDGTVSGGPMHYLRDGLAELGWRRTGAVLAMLYAIVCMGGSFGGGCVFQVSQSLESLRTQVKFIDTYPWVFGVVLVFLAGIVIIGGIRRIAATAEKIVPLMCTIYVLAAIYILAVNWHSIPGAIELIFNSAFSSESIYGGFLGAMVVGIKRGAFSNEAGLGSAAIAHAAAKTNEPVREGIVALLGPFIDTVIICSMTGLVIVITGVYDNPQFAGYIQGDKGVPLTSEAFRTAIWWFPYLLTVAVCLFAYSTLISWSYYGERCWSLLFGRQTSLLFKIIFLGFVFLGSIVSPSNLLKFSDLMILSMAFPNILGLIFLSGKIRRALDDYWRRFQAGELDPKNKNLATDEHR